MSDDTTITLDDESVVELTDAGRRALLVAHTAYPTSLGAVTDVDARTVHTAAGERLVEQGLVDVDETGVLGITGLGEAVIRRLYADPAGPGCHHRR